MTKLEEGNPAPDFDLPTDGDRRLALADLAGKMVVLYFYPKDDTPGCTKEAIAFSALREEFEKAGAVVIGVSPDTPAKHDKFKAKHGLSVHLAADTDQATANAYGVWVEKSMYGRKYMGIERSTFLIGPDGALLKIWRKVKVAGHAEAVLDAVRAQG
ncbi:peroxiredoxin [Stappia indica]|uniref:peroxiredoxin n=1 Tax=Stappia indica TaxID=538381 RepID=UPI001CD692DB|nr:peroxiredoxin [Stappia indica]MCA1298641.1 peroxiredoxin [Stappia indica]